MALMKIRVGDTPTVVKYAAKKNGIHIRKIAALNHKNGNRWSGRRYISFELEVQNQIKFVITQALMEGQNVHR